MILHRKNFKASFKAANNMLEQQTETDERKSETNPSNMFLTQSCIDSLVNVEDNNLESDSEDYRERNRVSQSLQSDVLPRIPSDKEF